MDLKESIRNLQKHLDDVSDHTDKLTLGKKASAPKLRASLMKLRNDAQQMRMDTQTHLKTLPVKSKKSILATGSLAPSEAAVESGNVEPEEETKVVDILGTKTTMLVKKPRKPRVKKSV